MARQLAQRLARISGIAIALGVAAPGALAEAVYKWTDAEGVTHFSALPPEGQAAEQVTVEAPPPNAAQADEEARDAAAGDGRPQDPAAGLEGPSPDEIARQEAQRKQNCETAKQNLETLKTRVHVRVRDEETGEDRYLTPEEHTQWQKDSSMRIEEYCKPPGGV
jgi:hypothetical protein